VHLRAIIGAVRISNDPARVGDLAKNIGKRVMPLPAAGHRVLGIDPSPEYIDLARANDNRVKVRHRLRLTRPAQFCQY